MSSVQSVLSGQNYYRILSEFTSSDIVFPVENSMTAALVGPESDFDEYDLTFFDPTTSTVQKIVVTKDRPWFGRLDSLPSSLLPNGVPNVISVSPRNLFDAVSLAEASGADSPIVKIPTIDFVVYFGGDLPQAAGRSSRRITLPVSVLLDKASSVIIPVFGRATWSIALLRNGNSGAFTFGVQGLRLIRTVNLGSQSAQVVALKVATVLPTNPPNQDKVSVDHVHNSSLAGYFDYVVGTVTASGGASNVPAASTGGGLQIIFDARD